MNAFEDERPERHDPPPPQRWALSGVALGGLLLRGARARHRCLQRLQDRGRHRPAGRADPPRGARARARHGTGPASRRMAGTYYKGVQSGGPNDGVLTEGRYFYNPYFWSWEISPQFVVPGDKIGIRIALSGDDHAAGQILAEPGQKGILREVLQTGTLSVQPLCRVDRAARARDHPRGLSRRRHPARRAAAEEPQRLPGRGRRTRRSAQDARTGNLLPQSRTRSASARSIAGRAGSTWARKAR